MHTSSLLPTHTHACTHRYNCVIMHIITLHTLGCVHVRTCTYITHTQTLPHTHMIYMHVRMYVDEHPASQTVFVSEKASLCVSTTGTTPTGYQWQRALLPGRERGKDGREEGEGEDGREEEGGEDGMREEEKWKDVAEGRGHIGATSMRLDLPCVDASENVIRELNSELIWGVCRDCNLTIPL